MYRVMIVDDEALVREAVKEQMNWSELGYRCVADCEDGLEALEYMEHTKPDVVLTDINMPFMDGLELTREISARYPGVKVIILTGFDDFEYARQAVKLKAYDFVLKPISAAELGQVFLKLRQELDMETTKAQDLEQLQKKVQESWPLLKERFLEQLVASPMPWNEVEEKCAYFRLEWTGSYLIEIAVEVDELLLDKPAAPHDQILLRFAVFNIAQEIVGERQGAVTFRDREGRILILLSQDHADQLQDAAMMIAEQIRDSVNQYLPVSISIGIGHSCHLTNIPTAHQSSLSALNYKFIYGSNEVIRITDMEKRSRPELLSLVEWEKMMVSKLKTGAIEETEEWIEQMLSGFRNQLFPVEACKLFIQRLVLSIIHTVYEIGGDTSGLLGKESNLLAEVAQFTSLHDIGLWLKQLCRNTVLSIRSAREDYSSLQVTKAVAYVQQHYKDTDLSLSSVCKHISMSNSYFSTLFKNRTGMSFVEFVTSERMEKAKELLKFSSLKSFEIAHEVGFNDPHYFSGTFKKYTGMAPTEYRHKMSAGQSQ